MRITNTDVVCQIVSARIQGDFVIAAAYAHELPRYGITIGLTNYAAVYCTGLLVARRVLSILGIDKVNFDADEDSPRAFKAFLDTGLHRTSTGSKVFAAMKGAVDGGLNIPHSEQRFPGYDKEKKSLDAEVLREHIMGGHVADYMRQLQEQDASAYERQFSRFIKAGVTADTIEGMYTKAHDAIRANPLAEPKKAAAGTGEHGSKKFKATRLTYAERKAAVAEKIAAFKETIGQA